jgi:hypothetical protein
MRTSPPVLFAVLAALFVACISGPVSTVPLDGGGVLGSPCQTQEQCQPNLCGFPISAGCHAQGVCVTEEFSCTGDGPIVCGCDGRPVELACIWGYGYAPAPIVSATPGCQPGLDGGFDAGRD